MGKLDAGHPAVTVTSVAPVASAAGHSTVRRATGIGPNSTRKGRQTASRVTGVAIKECGGIGRSRRSIVPADKDAHRG